MFRKKPLLAIGSVFLAAAAVYLGFRLTMQEPPAVEMPYADLLETAALKWGLHFPDDWSVWEERIDQSLKDHFAHLKTAVEPRRVEYFKRKYRQMWARGVSLDEIPPPVHLDLDSESDQLLMETLRAGRDGVRIDEHAMYVDLMRRSVYSGGGWTMGHFDGEPAPLSDEEHYRLMYRGVSPDHLNSMYVPKTIYIGKYGRPLKLAIGELPAELDPAEPFKKMSDAELQTAVRRLAQIVNRPTAHQQKTLDAASKDSVDLMYLADLFGGIMEAWRERPSAWEGVSMEPLPAVASSGEKAEADASTPSERAPAAKPPAGTPYLYADAYASPVRAEGIIHGDLNGKAVVKGAVVEYIAAGKAESSIVFADNSKEPPLSRYYDHAGKHRGSDPGIGNVLIQMNYRIPVRIKYLIARTYCPWDRFWLWLNDPARYSISSQASAIIQDDGAFPEVWGSRESRARYPSKAPN